MAPTVGSLTLLCSLSLFRVSLFTSVKLHRHYHHEWRRSRLQLLSMHHLASSSSLSSSTFRICLQFVPSLEKQKR
ncbi:hypothetical protein Hanom_Chr10g00906621 [Helianthus anomalus]